MPDDDIDHRAARSYAEGRDAIDEAVARIALLLEIRDDVIQERETTPSAFQLFGDTAPDVVGRRVVASLLNAGWKPPSDDERDRAVASYHRQRREFDTWKAALAPGEWERAVNYYSEHDEWPPDLQPPRA